MTWSLRYRNSLSLPHDKIESIDTNPPSRGIEGGGRAVDGVVSIDSIVSLGKKRGKGTLPDILPAPSPAVAALGGTGEALPLPHWPPGHWRPRRYTSDLTDQLWTTMARPISWADPAARPEEGAFCSNCEYATWARDKRRADGGWCCSICHPADQIPPADRDAVRW